MQFYQLISIYTFLLKSQGTLTHLKRYYEGCIVVLWRYVISSIRFQLKYYLDIFFNIGIAFLWSTLGCPGVGVIGHLILLFKISAKSSKALFFSSASCNVEDEGVGYLSAYIKSCIVEIVASLDVVDGTVTYFGKIRLFQICVCLQLLEYSNEKIGNVPLPDQHTSLQDRVVSMTFVLMVFRIIMYWSLGGGANSVLL